MTKETFYKAVRPDGGSFHDPTVIYEVGKRVRPKPVHTEPGNQANQRELALCGPGVLHASRTPIQAASYAGDPFILFKVTGIPVLEQSDKAGFKQLTVIEPVETHEAYGPQGVQVLAALDRIKVLSHEEFDAFRARDRDRDWDWARARARDWARDRARDRARARARDRDWARDRAREYCADYVAAISIQDLIDDTYTQADHDLFVAPWEEIVGVWDPDTGTFMREAT